MNKLVAFFVDRPLMSNIILIGFIAVALKTLRNIQKEGFPKILTWLQSLPKKASAEAIEKSFQSYFNLSMETIYQEAIKK